MSAPPEYKQVRHETLVNQCNQVEEAERKAVQIFNNRQFAALLRRHPLDEILILPVLADNYQHAAVEAKSKRVATARYEMYALDEMALALSGDQEIQSVCHLSSLPVWALILWLEGCPEDAIEKLHGALQSCIELTNYSHDYLTAKRIHLAANIGRVLVSVGSESQAFAHVTSLQAVVAGDRDKWPFEGRKSLDVPLEGSERLSIEYQLSRITDRINSKSMRYVQPSH